MANGGELRNWDELVPDALSLIFRNLSLCEVLTVIPSVCKSWHNTVMGTYCWQEMDTAEWNINPEHVDRLLRVLVLRSCGSLRKLSVSCLYEETTFCFIAEKASSLQTLRLTRSDIGDSIVEQLVSRLSTLTSLDLSYCRKIGCRALEAIGKHCKSLVEFNRNVHPFQVLDKDSQDDEALAIATSMPKLRHLEMAFLLISTQGVLEILSSCLDLKLLDLRGCWGVKFEDNKFVKEKYPNLKVLGPIFDVDEFSERLNFPAGPSLEDSEIGYAISKRVSRAEARQIRLEQEVREIYRLEEELNQLKQHLKVLEHISDTHEFVTSLNFPVGPLVLHQHPSTQRVESSVAASGVTQTLFQRLIGIEAKQIRLYQGHQGAINRLKRSKQSLCDSLTEKKPRRSDPEPSV